MAMHVRKRLADLGSKVEDLLDGQACGPFVSSHQTPQGPPLDALHDEIGPALRIRDDLRNGGMVEPQSNPLFSFESGVEREVAFELKVRNLEYDVPACRDLARRVHRTHAAARDHACDLEVVESASRLQFAA